MWKNNKGSRTKENLNFLHFNLDSLTMAETIKLPHGVLTNFAKFLIGHYELDGRFNLTDLLHLPDIKEVASPGRVRRIVSRKRDYILGSRLTELIFYGIIERKEEGRAPLVKYGFTKVGYDYVKSLAEELVQ